MQEAAQTSPSAQGGSDHNIQLAAKYSSPTNQPFNLASTIDSSSESSTGVDSKTAHLRSLRAAVSAIQEQVNKELTARMEEDKARDGGAATGSTTAAVDEAKEEENYGEEEQGDDDDE